MRAEYEKLEWLSGPNNVSYVCIGSNDKRPISQKFNFIYKLKGVLGL